MNSQPALSVVMPILNEERHLESAVERVFNQDYSGQVELILALGPSADRTNEIAVKLAQKFSSIKLINN
ncbi:MAG: glycosyltransferase, partial [Candidatus Nanopelagicales bacterium]